jgi:hypothetical protein
MAVDSAYATGAPQEVFGAAKILGGVHIQEPQGRGQTLRMGCVAGLDQVFNRKHGHRLFQARRGRLKS